MIGPVVHHASSVIRTGKLMHHWRERSDSFEIRRGDMHLWPNHAAAVDQLFDLEIVVRLNAAGSANRGHAERQIESREAESHVRVHRWRATHWKEHVIVHADETGQYGVALQIQHRYSRLHEYRGAWMNLGNLSIDDENCLILHCRCASAVNHAHVS